MSGTAPLIVLEGIDGAGKGTQTQLLQQALSGHGRNVASFSFPRYQQTFFGARIGEFLHGDFGPLDQLDPFLISLLYAGDRFESRGLLQNARSEADVVLCDRYVPSNIAHQSAKKSGEARATLQGWIEQVEYQHYGLPQPDLVILLDISIEQSQALIARKARRSYTDRTTDLQESDTSYLSAVREVYLELAQRNPGWAVIPVGVGTEIRPMEQIHADVLAAALSVLNAPRPNVS